jgi:hypothetical protein
MSITSIAMPMSDTSIMLLMEHSRINGNDSYGIIFLTVLLILLVVVP